MIGDLGVFEVALTLFLVEEDILVVVLVDGPLRSSPIVRGHEIVVAGADEVARVLCLDGACFTAASDRFECRCDVGKFLNARADGSNVVRGFGAQRRRKPRQARLVPINAIRAYDIVEHPALFLKALHRRRRYPVRLGRRRCLRIERGEVRQGGHCTSGGRSSWHELSGCWRLGLRDPSAGGTNGQRRGGLDEGATMYRHAISSLFCRFHCNSLSP